MEDRKSTTFQEYVDARYNMLTLSSSDMILFIKRMATDKEFYDLIVKEYERWVNSEEEEEEEEKDKIK